MTNGVEKQSVSSRVKSFFEDRLSSPEQKQAKERARLRQETLDTLIDCVVVPTLKTAIDADRALWEGEATFMIFEMRSARLMMGIETSEVNDDPRVAPLIEQITAIKAITELNKRLEN